MSETTDQTDVTETSEAVDRDFLQEEVSIDETPETPTEPDTFPRAYVQELRNENAKYRDRAKSADTLAQRLHVELVRATGKLADPSDLPFDAAHLDDPDALGVAVDALLAEKPHLKSRRVTGDVGQGITGTVGSGVSLLDLMRGGIS